MNCDIRIQSYIHLFVEERVKRTLFTHHNFSHKKYHSNTIHTHLRYAFATKWTGPKSISAQEGDQSKSQVTGIGLKNSKSHMHGPPPQTCLPLFFSFLWPFAVHLLGVAIYQKKTSDAMARTSKPTSIVHFGTWSGSNPIPLEPPEFTVKPYDSSAQQTRANSTQDPDNILTPTTWPSLNPPLLNKSRIHDAFQEAKVWNGHCIPGSLMQLV